MFKFRKKLSQFGEIEISDAVAYGGDHERRKIEEPVGLVNLKRFLKIIMLLILVLGFRSAYLQIARGSYYLGKADQNRISKRIIKAPRGIITDRNGEVLVNNMASFDAVIIPAFLPGDTQSRQNVLDNCFNLMHWESLENLTWPRAEELEYNSFKPFLVKENISRDEALAIEVLSKDCPGFITEKTAKREYISGPVFAHILGYTGRVQAEDLERNPDYLMTDDVGRTGVEEFWENELKGRHGFNSQEVNSAGDILRELEEELPKPGSRLVLGVDKDLQEKLFWKTEEMLNEMEKRKAVVIMMDPRNGAIRALVSFPSYDNNLFAGQIKQSDYQALLNDPAKPLLNRAISGTYSPGSTIKPLWGVSILEENLVTPETTFDCPGFLQWGEWRFGDWKTHGPNINLKQAIAQSCDVYFYIVSGGYGDQTGLGVERMKKYAEIFGFDQITGIDLNGERKGLIPSPEWKLEVKNEKWYIGNTFHISIGQGDLAATPIQLVNYISAIANGGTLYKPHLISQITDEATGEVLEDLDNEDKEILRQDLAKRKNIDAVREGMRETVAGEKGSAKTLNELGHNICGKTGTSQMGGTEETNSWFVGFAPYDNPEIAIMVLVEEGGESSDSAVPIAKEAFKYYFGIEEEEEDSDDEKDTVEENNLGEDQGDNLSGN